MAQFCDEWHVLLPVAAVYPMPPRMPYRDRRSCTSRRHHRRCCRLLAVPGRDTSSTPPASGSPPCCDTLIKRARHLCRPCYNAVRVVFNELYQLAQASARGRWQARKRKGALADEWRDIQPLSFSFSAAQASRNEMRYLYKAGQRGTAQSAARTSGMAPPPMPTPALSPPPSSGPSPGLIIRPHTWSAHDETQSSARWSDGDTPRSSSSSDRRRRERATASGPAYPRGAGRTSDARC